MDLNDEYSILQIISGLGALKNGSVRVSGNNLQGNINVTGLEPEKSYVLYYVALDAEDGLHVLGDVHDAVSQSAGDAGIAELLLRGLLGPGGQEWTPTA